MSSSSSYFETDFKEESTKFWTGDTRPDFEGKKTQGQLAIPVDILDISTEGKAALEKQASITTSSTDESDKLTYELSDTDKQKIIMIKKMLEALTGKKIKFYVMDDIKLKKAFKDTDLQKAIRIQQPAPQKQGWGLEYEYNASHYEAQKMSFQSEGIVRTTDGREINFKLEMNMSREFASQQNISIRAGDAVKVDPLVINLSNSAPSLTEQKYSFDLDNNGTLDQISFVKGSSGFLTLDLNNDSIINNGSELFGPQNGDGFAELAKYDSDSNGWIDEADSVYDKLRIWTKDETGADKLIALGQAGVGAIYLGNVNTSFDLKGSSNQLQGEIAKTGVYLKENGTAGTIQHINLAI
jgi:hypothetical protein